jgi:hypothetical protein
VSAVIENDLEPMKCAFTGTNKFIRMALEATATAVLAGLRTVLLTRA